MSHRLLLLMILMFYLMYLLSDVLSSYQIYHVLFVIDQCLTSQLILYSLAVINMVVYYAIIIFKGKFIYSFEKGSFCFTNIILEHLNNKTCIQYKNVLIYQYNILRWCKKLIWLYYELLQM